MSGRRLVEFDFESGDKRVVQRVIGSRLADRWHLSGGQLPHHLFPDVGMGSHIVGAERYQELIRPASLHCYGKRHNTS